MNPELDEFDIFGKCVAIQLKNIPIDLALETQLKLQEHITQIRCKLLRHQINIKLNKKGEFVNESIQID